MPTKLATLPSLVIGQTGEPWAYVGTISAVGLIPWDEALSVSPLLVALLLAEDLGKDRSHRLGGCLVAVRQQVRVCGEHRLWVVSEPSGDDVSGTGGLAVSAKVAAVWRRTCRLPLGMPAARR